VITATFGGYVPVCVILVPFWSCPELGNSGPEGLEDSPYRVSAAQEDFLNLTDGNVRLSHTITGMECEPVVPLFNLGPDLLNEDILQTTSSSVPLFITKQSLNPVDGNSMAHRKHELIGSVDSKLYGLRYLQIVLV